MVYQFKVQGLYKVDAQTAGEELERIYTQNGCLEPGDIVEESRPENAPLHPVFEWDDAVAAEKYRQTQAGNLIRAVVVVEEPKRQADEIRAFVHVQETYRPMTVVVQSRDMMAELQDSALRELQAFQRKFSILQKVSAFRPVFTAIDVVEENMAVQM